MAAVGRCLPLTHGIAASRRLAAGASWSDVAGDVWREAGIGLTYLVIGLFLLAYFERQSHRLATLENR
jgi:ABC-2 type transport system permease protein